MAQESWNNARVFNCSASNNNQNFQANLISVQPTDNQQFLNYTRTISLHNFIVIRFELILSDWNPSSSFTLQLLNQVGNNIIPQQDINYLSNVPRGTCSSIQNQSAHQHLSTNDTQLQSRSKIPTQHHFHCP